MEKAVLRKSALAHQELNVDQIEGKCRYLLLMYITNLLND
jgi:hypothetical protein